MRVEGPNKREMSGVLAQLRHLYKNMLEHGDPAVRSMAEGLLARQIRRLESLDRVLFEATEMPAPRQPLPTPEHP